MKFRAAIGSLWSSLPAPMVLARRQVQLRIAAGDRERDRRNWQAAASAYARALAVDPDLAPIWVQYGHAMKEAGDRSAAEAAYRRALECGLDDADTYLQLGHVLKLQGRQSDAIEAYGEALRREPGHPAVLQELSHLGWTRRDFRRLLAAEHATTGLVDAAAPARLQTGSARLCLDLSDVVHFALSAERPTGIQRVQLAVVSAVLARRSADPPMLLAYTSVASYWVEIDLETFRELADLMSGTASGRDAGRAWDRLRRRLTMQLSAGPDAEIPPQSRIVNLGSSWSLGNYFLALRRARERSGIVYIAFIHDLIPVIHPEWFVPDLQRDFRQWLEGIGEAADHFLANSRSTAADLRRVMERLGRHEISATVIPLDAAFGPSHSPSSGDDGDKVLATNGLASRQFVLFVSSIEPRKNHVMVFRAWQELIAKRGAANVPMLVCVGSRGWRNREALAMLERSAELADRVRLMRGVGDGDLDALYRACRFSVYPSLYEGWGLPITESLSKGRLPLVARTSSLPEAGGMLAEYFSPDDPQGFLAALERLIDDEAYVASREAEIVQRFRPRSWDDIAVDVLAASESMQPRSRTSVGSPVLAIGEFVRLARDPPGSMPSGVTYGEHFRYGSGWSEPDDRGCWIFGEGAAELRFGLPPDVTPDTPLRLRLLVYATRAPGLGEGAGGTPDDALHHIVLVRMGPEEIGRFRISADAERWLAVDVSHAVSDQADIRLTFQVCDRNLQARTGRCVGLAGMFIGPVGDIASQTAFIEGVILGSVHERIGGGSVRSSDAVTAASDAVASCNRPGQTVAAMSREP